MNPVANRKGILVVQGMGLGDLMFSVPVLRVLKRTFPEDPITFFTNQPNAPLLSLVPEVETTLAYRNKNPAELIRSVSRVRARRCRMAIVLNPIFRGTLLAWLAGIPIRIGYRRDYERKQSLFGLDRILLTEPCLPRDQKMHEVDRYLDLLARMGWIAREEERRPRLVPSQKILPSPNRHVVVHPGAGWEMRCWPEERFAQLADGLVYRYGARVSFIGGAEEKGLVERIRRRMEAEAANLAGTMTLPQLAEFLTGAHLFIGNDTGTLHMAAALGIPLIGLFGPGDPEKVRPLSPRATVLRHPVPWGPCKVQYTRRCENNLCMKDISVGEVLEAVTKTLGPAGQEPAPPKQFRSPDLKRILYLQSTSEISGTDIALLRTVETLDRNRFEPHVVLHREGPFAEEYRRAGCRVHLVASMRQLTVHRGFGYLARCLLGYPFAVAQLTRLVRRERIALIHTNTIHNPYGFLTAILSKTPHVWHVREIVMQSPFLRWLENGLVQRFSDRFIVMDNAIAETFLKRGGGLPARIAKLYDGVDLTAFHPGISGSRIRQELGLSEQTPLIGMVSRLDPAKGPDLFLKVAARVLKQRPDCRFWLCGGEIQGHEGLEAALKKQAQGLGISNQVLFTGWRYRFRETPEAYRALDLCLVCPRNPEPYGLWCVEAMASGVPIVTFAEGGPAELCKDGETALLVPPGNIDKTAEAVADLLRNPAKARAMGEAGRKRAERLFDLRRCVQELEGVYDELLGRGSDAHGPS